MPYPIKYFDIQIIFAKKATEITEEPLDASLLMYTGFYKELKIQDWDFDKDNPEWKRYLSRIHIKDVITQETYEYYLEQVKKCGEIRR